MKVYLAGDIAYENRWRPKVAEAVKPFLCQLFSPIDTIDYNLVALERANKDNQVFVPCDFKKIDLCDILFAYIRNGSGSLHSGTSCEIGYAKAKGKHIILVKNLPKLEAYLYQFIQRTADAYFTVLEDGIKYLVEFVSEMEYDPTTDWKKRMKEKKQVVDK